MTVSLGHETVGVIGKQTDWDAEVACTNAGILLLNANVSRNARPHHIPESSQTWPRQDCVVAGAKRFTGTYRQILRYEDLRFPTYLFGAGSNYATPAEQTGGQDDYLHLVDLATDIEGLHFSLGLKHGSDIQALVGNKAQQMRIFNEPGDDLTVKCELATLLYNETWQSATIVAGSFASPTFPGDREDVVRFDQLVAKIGDHNDSTDLGAGDVININSFDLTIRRIMAAEADNVSGQFIREPVNDGQELDLVTLTLNFPDFNIDSRVKDYIADLYALQHAMVDLCFTGSQVKAGENRKLQFLFPEMVVGDMGDTGNYGGPGRLPGSVTLHAVQPGDTSTGGGAPWDFDGLVRMAAINMQGSKAVV